MYACGALTKDESAAVEKLIRNNQDVKNEFEEILKSIMLLSSLRQKSPEESVKSSLLKSIRLKSGINNDNLQNVTEKSSIKKYSYMLAAAIVLLMLSITGNIYLIKNLKEYERQTAVLNDKIKLVNQDFDAVNNKLIRSTADMKIAMDKNYKMVILNGLEKSPSSKAFAFWNPVSKKVYIMVESLPIPPVNLRYQLWAISGGKPFNLGMIDLDPSDNSLHEMKNTDNVQAFAITLEPQNGSQNPTMTEMYAMGEI
ncbi:MAG: hypothetical protein HGGPFJEG_02752 [Ignavibacteria bacterium]|nr:hypothetical protein [Ignavibacteria bacterium]